jgi:opacity protein-like surface antigen
MKRLFTLAILFCACSVAFAQQDYVGRYDGFIGFSYLNTPSINLAGRGFNAEFGINKNRWLALGADYSLFVGHTSITPGMLTPGIQTQLAPLLPLLGPNPGIPFDSTSYTFTAGPQVNFRQLKWVTFFVRPDLGGMHQSANLKPASPVQALLLQRLVSGTKQTDLQLFYGVGGGFDINATDHMGIRVGLDYAHTKMFTSLLGQSQNNLRISVGPTFRFGPNVTGK